MMEQIKNGKENMSVANGGDDQEQKWVHDSSFDHKGRVPLRASTGAWKASLYIIGKDYNFNNLTSFSLPLLAVFFFFF